MIGSAYPHRRSDVETHIMPDGTCVLFDPISEEGLVLNAAGALVWDYCDGMLTTDEIAAELAALLPENPQAHGDSLRLLDQLEQSGVLLTQGRATDAG